jgi:hypothetical protein
MRAVTLVPRTHPSPSQIDSIHKHRKGFCSSALKGSLPPTPCPGFGQAKVPFFQPLEARNTLLPNVITN